MKYGDWVMYNNNPHKVSRQIGDRIYLYPDRLRFDEREMIVPLNRCTPITKEVADIMRGV